MLRVTLRMYLSLDFPTMFTFSKQQRRLQEYMATSSHNITSQIVVHDEMRYVYSRYLSVTQEKMRSTQNTPK